MIKKRFRNELLEDYSPIEIKNLIHFPSKPKLSITNFLIVPIITIAVYIIIFKYVMQSNGNFYLFFVVFAIVGIVASIIRYVTERITWRKECQRVEKENDEYIAALTKLSISNGDTYKKEMIACFPEINNPKSYNWIRLSNQKSFMNVRIGKYTGRNPAHLYWGNDDLKNSFESRYRDCIDSTMSITNLPYIVDLKKHKIISVFGKNKELIFNNIIMNTFLFHTTDDLRICTLNCRPEFSWCKRIPHSNMDGRFSLYAETVNDIYELLKELSHLLHSSDSKVNIMILTSDNYLLAEKIRNFKNQDRVILLVMCDDEPTSWCDVAIGNDTIAFSNRVTTDIVNFDTLSIEKSFEYVKNIKALEHKAKTSINDELALPEYIDAFSFFGPPQE